MWRDAALLLDMLIAAREAHEFSEGLTWGGIPTELSSPARHR
jgi:hypothetical protein